MMQELKESLRIFGYNKRRLRYELLSAEEPLTNERPTSRLI